MTEKDIETGQPELRLALDSTRIRLAHLVDQAEAEPERCAWPAVICEPVGFADSRGETLRLPHQRCHGRDCRALTRLNEVLSKGADAVARAADQTGSAVLIVAVLQRSDVEATTVRCLRAWLSGARRVSAWTGNR